LPFFNLKTSPLSRIESIDLLRGLVMVLMALDHSREFMHSSVLLFNPTDPAKTTLLLFATRWVTHFCAPVFFLLAGFSARFSGRKKTKKELSVFLLKRGVWLIFIDITVITFVWTLNFHCNTFYFAVLSALGLSMILLAGLIHLNDKLILAISLVIIAGHNLLDGVNMHDNFIPALLHSKTSFALPGSVVIGIDYPVVPWIAVMSLGYWFGRLYEKDFDSGRRRRTLAWTGLGAIILFLVLRWTDVYGDPSQRQVFGTNIQTLMSFLNITKYPPSLLFLLATLGPGLVFLAFSENLHGKVTRFFSVFGRVPFFFYILHLYLLLLVYYSTFHIFNYLAAGPDVPATLFRLTGFTKNGFSLAVVYLVWITLIALSYPLCRFYDRYKTAHKDRWWLSYI
jgi:uncharacterized membrane protein